MPTPPPTRDDAEGLPARAGADRGEMSAMVRLIREQRLGFVATVNVDGTPNMSPKGTFVVVDAATVAFGDGTLGNLAARPAMEISFMAYRLLTGSSLPGGVSASTASHGWRLTMCFCLPLFAAPHFPTRLSASGHLYIYSNMLRATSDR